MFRYNTRAIVDGYGNIVNVYYYDVFGRCWNNTWDKANDNQFVGGYGVLVEKEIVGLIYMRARYYKADIGRFLTRDPIKDYPDYIYCANNPIMLIDPFGTSPIGEINNIMKSRDVQLAIKTAWRVSYFKRGYLREEGFWIRKLDSQYNVLHWTTPGGPYWVIVPETMPQGTISLAHTHVLEKPIADPTIPSDQDIKVLQYYKLQYGAIITDAEIIWYDQKGNIITRRPR